MFERLTVKNFQAHEVQALDLNKEKVTTILGVSDIGKSALLKALRCLCLGEWDSGYVRHGEKECLLGLTFDNGKTLKRRKGPGVNLLKLNKKEFKAFGTKMPEEISDVLNVSDLNFQRQFDSHFWLADSPVEIARALNEIINLACIDEIQSNVAGDLRGIKAEIKVVEKRIEELEADLKSTEWVVDVVDELAALIQLEDQYFTVDAQHADLTVLFKSVQSHAATANHAKELHSLGVVTVQAGEAYRAVSQQLTQIQNLLESLDYHSHDIVDIPDISEMKVIYTEMMTVAGQVTKITTLVANITKSQTEITKLEKDIASCRLRLKTMSPKKCLTCGQILTTSPQ